MLLFLVLSTSVLSGCDANLTPEERATKQAAREQAEQVEHDATIQRSMGTLNKINMFIKFCDENGGLKDFDMNKWCGGRGCYKPYIECNNGLSAWIDQ